jgi:oligopeptide/dipeptide ABC transporter ATP-binding protein
MACLPWCVGVPPELLRIDNLKTYFHASGGVVKAVDGVSLSIAEGQILGLVGESGSGKSMTCRSIMRLLPPSARVEGGHVYFRGEDVLTWSEAQLTSWRGAEVSMILQEPMTALNPVLTIGEQIMETIVQHEGVSRTAARRRAVDALRRVGIPGAERRLDEYAHQFSGGMRQRAMIAIALACRPKLLLADEPTTALDVTVQDQIIRLIQDLQREMGMSVIWVTHDLGVVAQLCDRVAVMYAGQIVELADVIDLYEASRHPYTRGLMESVPSGAARAGGLIPIPGQPPDLLDLPPGCAFTPRCQYAMPSCADSDTPLRAVKPGHMSACVRFEEIWR